MMKRNAPGFQYDDEIADELFDEEMNGVSGCEYTGLMPSQPLDEEEARAYSSVYDIPISSGMKSYRPKQ